MKDCRADAKAVNAAMGPNDLMKQTWYTQRQNLQVMLQETNATNLPNPEESASFPAALIVRLLTPVPECDLRQSDGASCPQCLERRLPKPPDLRARVPSVSFCTMPSPLHPFFTPSPSPLPLPSCTTAHNRSVLYLPCHSKATAFADSVWRPALPSRLATIV
jgi:hypothetical protein